MKIVIFGSSGGTGRELVRQGLAAGHEVTAFARSAAAITEEHRALRVVEGSVTDPIAVAAAVKGQDAVLSALGAKGKVRICAPGMANILAAMKIAHVPRVIAVSSFGAAESRDGSFYSRLVWLLLRDRMEDKCAMESVIADSNLEWTVVRPPALTNGKRTGRYQVGMHIRMPVVAKISRADVADFILRELASPRFVRLAPTIVA